MKHVSLILSLSLASLAAHAAQREAPAPAPNPPPATAKFENAPSSGQASKMKSCNADARARNLHGAERRSFMKQCLSKQGPTS